MGAQSLLGKLRDLFIRRTAVRDVRENPMLKEAVARAAEIFAETPLADLIDERRRKELARVLYLELSEICNASQPKAVCRDKLVRWMLRFAPLQVVMIPPPPEEDASGLRELPGITGELRPRLNDLLEHDADFRSGLGGQPADADAAWSAVQRSYWEAYWFLEAFNATRIALGDTKSESDWYRPFMHAACVNQEHLYRRELNLPPAFEEDVAQVVVTAFSIYTDVVISGTDDPDSEWNDYYAGLGVPPLERLQPVSTN